MSIVCRAKSYTQVQVIARDEQTPLPCEGINDAPCVPEIVRAKWGRKVMKHFAAQKLGGGVSSWRNAAHCSRMPRPPDKLILNSLIMIWFSVTFALQNHYLDFASIEMYLRSINYSRRGVENAYTVNIFGHLSSINLMNQMQSLEIERNAWTSSRNSRYPLHNKFPKILFNFTMVG